MGLKNVGEYKNFLRNNFGDLTCNLQHMKQNIQEFDVEQTQFYQTHLSLRAKNK